MKVIIDKEKCFGCGGCVASIEKAFEFDDEGKAQVINGKIFTKDDKTFSQGNIEEDTNKIKEFIENKYCPGDAIKY